MAIGSLVELSLETVAGGAALELFDRELYEVLQNIQDPNTDPEAVRSVKVEVLIKPTKDRESAAVALKVTSKAAPTKAISDLVYMGRRDGRLVAVTRDPRQGDMFGGTPDVLPLRPKEATP